MSDLEKKSKKELLDIIDQLREKLGEVKGVEEKQDALENNLPGIGFSVVIDRSGDYKIVEIGFDFDSKAATITNVRELATNGYEYALYDAKKFLIEKIMSAQNINHLKESKNG
jgi:hypothetical protein